MVLAPAVIAIQFARPSLVPYLWWLSAYLALACGVIAHNHNHCPTFKSKRANQIFGNWISIFYGYPTFAWIPTHNLNHHKFVNRAGDATITWRYTNRHNALVASTYFFISSYWQSDPIKAFIRKAKTQNPSLYRRILMQYCIWGGAHLALFGLAIGLHGLRGGAYLYLMTCGIPAFFALWTIMLFNYDQHVHTDPWSKHNHSRSWDGRLLNFLLFNNGYHCAHHENPGTHWSKLREAHEIIAPHIDPALIESSLAWYWFREYFVALFVPSLGSKQIGRAPFDPPDGKAVNIESADVDVGEAGTNAQMVGS
ncbi:MAG TPA: fatty acid desaturase [Polyangiaceae bacterium]